MLCCLVTFQPFPHSVEDLLPVRLTAFDAAIRTGPIHFDFPLFSLFFSSRERQEIYGYRRSMMKSIVTYLIIVMTIGILRLVYHWFPEWFLNCTHSKCSLESAEKVLVVVSNPRHIGRFSHNRFITFCLLNGDRSCSRRSIAGFTFGP